MLHSQEFSRGMRVIALDINAMILIKGKREASYTQIDDETGEIVKKIRIKDDSGNERIIRAELVFPIFYEQQLNDALGNYRRLMKAANRALFIILDVIRRKEKIGKHSQQ